MQMLFRTPSSHLSKPQQFPSIVEALIAWQQRQGCCIILSVCVFICSPQIFSILKNVGFVNRYVRHSVCSSSNGLVASLAIPDSDGVSLDSGLSAECADVLGVLCDFHLLDLLSEGGTVSIN
jgi:hypothetical protein